MKKIIQASLVASVLTTAVAAQAAEVSGNVTLTSDYVWRGVSQTQNNGAIQGGFDVSDESGFYAGAWGSNVDFDNNASLELDLYAGYGTDLTEEVSLDVGIVKYTYPDASGGNFTEAYVNLGFAGFTLGYAADGGIFAGESSEYISLSYDVEVSDVALSFSYGNYDYRDDTYGTADDYDNWSVSASKAYKGVDVALTYTDTDLTDLQCGSKDFCEGILAVSISKSL